MKYVKSQEISNLLKDVKIPKMFHAVQEFKKDRIEPERIPALVYEDRKSTRLNSSHQR